MLLDNSLPFDAVHTFECGQCFRWNEKDGVYTGISNGKICRVKNREIICDPCDEEYWHKYFGLDIDYNAITEKLNFLDDKIKPCTSFGSGIRILKQDTWETIISFIISANNNIPRIKKIIETMCCLFGEKLVCDGEAFYSFPTPEALAALDKAALAPLKAGYRDTYILDAAQKVASGEVNLDSLSEMSDEEAKKTLMKIKGIGGKVADCILLFALGRYSVFPKDVWIKRILSEVYGINEKDADSFVKEKYGELSGFAQQYLYFYYRSIPNTKNN